MSPYGAVSHLAAIITGKGDLHVVWAAYTEGETSSPPPCPSGVGFQTRRFPAIGRSGR